MLIGTKMADIKSEKERSLNMSRIRSKDTKPEVWLRKRLFARGYRYRKNVGNIQGHPDIWMKKYNTAIFVHGCFWHRHSGCKYAYTPKSRVDFWLKKFDLNIERDKRVNEALLDQNIRILILWECTIKRMYNSPDIETKIMDKIDSFMISQMSYLEL